MAQNLLTMADNLPEEDPKFDQMLEAIMEKQNQENNKIILFSTFRYTLYYLCLLYTSIPESRYNLL